MYLIEVREDGSRPCTRSARKRHYEGLQFAIICCPACASARDAAARGDVALQVTGRRSRQLTTPSSQRRDGPGQELEVELGLLAGLVGPSSLYCTVKEFGCLVGVGGVGGNLELRGLLEESKKRATTKRRLSHFQPPHSNKKTCSTPPQPRNPATWTDLGEEKK
jgi:hypothetical protein